jgi:hypothetical protein
MACENENENSEISGGNENNGGADSGSRKLKMAKMKMAKAKMAASAISVSGWLMKMESSVMAKKATAISI